MTSASPTEKSPLLGVSQSSHNASAEFRPQGEASRASAERKTSNPINAASDLHFHAQIYKKRWWILFVFCFGSMSQSMLWNTWSPLNDSVLIAYGWKDSFVALLPALSNGGYVLLAFPLMYLVETQGLRLGLLFAVSLLVFGTAAWCIALPTGQTWLIAIGSLLNGITACITMAAPPLLSVLWFPMSERTTATAFAAMSGYSGTGLAFITGPYISGAHVTADDVKNKANLTSDFIQQLQKGISDVVYFDTAVAVVAFILVLVYFPAKPAKPPSRSQTKEREDFWHGIKHLALNPQFWILNLAFNVPNGAFNSWLPFLTVNFLDSGIGETTAGWIGFSSIIVGCVGSIGISMVADKFKRKTKFFLILMSICSIVLFGVLALIQERYIPVSADYINAVLYILCSAVSLCVNGVIPLYYELGCESAYPVHEGLSCSFITVINNIVGMSYFLLFLIPPLGTKTEWMTWSCFGINVFSLPLLIVLKEKFYRLDVETSDSDDEDEGVPAVEA